MEGKLLHYLKGTILDGSKKVIATEDGKLPEDLRKFIREKGVNFIARSRSWLLLPILRDVLFMGSAGSKFTGIHGVRIQ